MENKKEFTNFVNYGTYRAEEAEILRSELEKQAIPVKIFYPGTGIGKEATAGAYFTAYQIMIRFCDFQIAEEVRKRFNIEPIKTGEEMPLPKTYAWAKRGLNQFALIGYLVSFFGILITSYLLDKLEFFSENILFYFVAAFSIFFFLWLFSTIYNILKERKK